MGSNKARDGPFLHRTISKRTGGSRLTSLHHLRRALTTPDELNNRNHTLDAPQYDDGKTAKHPNYAMQHYQISGPNPPTGFPILCSMGYDSDEKLIGTSSIEDDSDNGPLGTNSPAFDSEEEELGSYETEDEKEQRKIYQG